MVNMEFGKNIEKLIQFSGQKNYSLAKELGYDVSYISKWISGAMLPASKNIKNICEKTAKFVVDNATEIHTCEILAYYKLDINKYSSDESIIQYIQDMLNESYLFSSQKKANKNYIKVGKENTEQCNSLLYIKPRLLKKHLDEDIMDLTKKEIKNDVILLADLFSLGKDDKLHIAGIRSGSTIKTEMKNVRIRFLISFDENAEDIIFNTIVLMNMIKIYSNINFTFYSCKHAQYSLTSVIKENSFTYTVYTDTKQCLFTNVSQDPKVVQDIYESLEEMIETRSRITFLEKNPREIILEKNYIEYMIGRDLRWLIGNMSELFMPSDLFLEIGKIVFGESKEIVDELKNIDAVLQNAIYKSNIQILMYENAIRQYISNGRLSFFNTTITLSLKQRQRHIEYMEKILKENEDIDIKLINGNLVDDFKNKENPTAYLSRNINIIKGNFDEYSEYENKYLIIRDNRLDNIFKRFFKEVWESERYNISKFKEEAIIRISDLLNYINILKSTVEK